MRFCIARSSARRLTGRSSGSHRGIASDYCCVACSCHRSARSRRGGRRGWWRDSSGFHSRSSSSPFPTLQWLFPTLWLAHHAVTSPQGGTKPRHFCWRGDSHAWPVVPIIAAVAANHEAMGNAIAVAVWLAAVPQNLKFKKTKPHGNPASQKATSSQWQCNGADTSGLT